VVGRAQAFGIPAVTVDGMDVDVVLAAAGDAVALARDGGGPSFLECSTYRFEGHHTMEKNFRLDYRSEAEIDGWRLRDPLTRAAAQIPTEARERIDTEIDDLLTEAVRFALDSPHPDPAGAQDYLYASGLRGRAGWSA
jgi:pyruvate dehydrogenase E1 component alpha subunit